MNEGHTDGLITRGIYPDDLISRSISGGLDEELNPCGNRYGCTVGITRC